MTRTPTEDLRRTAAASAVRTRLTWAGLCLIVGAVTLLAWLGMAAFLLPQFALFTTDSGHHVLDAVTGYGRLVGGGALLIGGLLLASGSGLHSLLVSARNHLVEMATARRRRPATTADVDHRGRGNDA